MKRLACIILALALLMAGCTATTAEQTNATPATETAPTATSAPTPTPAPEFNLLHYKADIALSGDRIIAAAEILYGLARLEIQKWKNDTKGKLTSEDVFEQGMDGIEIVYQLTADDLRTEYDNIREEYRNITLKEASGKQAEEIYKAYKSLYDNYISLFRATTAPSGTLSNFTDSCSDYMTNATMAYEDLALFVK